MEGLAMIGCKEVATLLSTDEAGSHSGWRRFKVQLHLAVCRPCRRFRRQLVVLHDTAAALDARYDAEVGSDFADRIHEKTIRGR